MAVTIKDIAKKAGVSYSTVSRALNGLSVVSDEKKEKIIEISQEMGYIPNQTAINLKTNKSYTIGLYFSTISKMTSPQVLHDVLTAVYGVVGSKYLIVVKGIDMHEEGTLNPAVFDGIIFLSQMSEDEKVMGEVLNKKIPFVVLNRIVHFNVPTILTDEAKGVKRTMEYLLSHGHRKIAVIEGSKKLDSTKTRHRGWMAAVRQSGMNPYEIPVEYGDYRYASGYYAAKKLLPFKPTAILCFNDEMAFGAERAINEMGLKVPDDISLIGFDNWNLSMLSKMQITTIERNMGLIAKRGTEILLDWLETGNTKEKRVYLDTLLVERNSVKTIQ